MSLKDYWRNVPGYEELYQISIETKEGKCRSLNYKLTGKIKELSTKPGKDGRIKWVLCKNGNAKCRQAAKWIALTYPELVQNEYFEGAEIDHIDCDKLNNHPNNLRWVSRIENMNNPITKEHLSKVNTGKKLSQTTKEKMSKAKLGKSTPHPWKSSGVLQYTKDDVFVKEYNSIKEASEITGICAATISSVCQKKPKNTGKGRFAIAKTAGGYKWEHKEKKVS